ncbi:MAG: MobC family plasmid mobilization relaxosome protein [Coriobacteriaceae bacterium]|nr:MobC family plasmid mobilization relaxosome protein [Coriobacteriaceae bacterium]MCI6843369.1 MobC family plasmid mobilization relaxosome protein [Coriobacteriaceae bacterium]MDD7585310.1 MobC family plasmid mobilization relaxosome protein [Coriobacteriaceae bacterium]
MSNNPDGGRGPSARSCRRSLYLTPELAERVEEVADCRGVTVNEVVVGALEQALGVGSKSTARQGGHRRTGPSAGPRDERVTVRMSEGEREALRDAAGAARLTEAQYVRARACYSRARILSVDDATLREVLAEMRREGTNLNQIARRANSLSDHELAREADAIASALRSLSRLQGETFQRLLSVVSARTDLRLGRG